jgi:hypothetical protein
MSYSRSYTRPLSRNPSNETLSITQPSTTHDVTETVKRRDKFDKQFAPLWEDFRNGRPVSAAHKQFLDKEFVSTEDFVYYSDVYAFHPGVELIDNRVTLIALPNEPHEAIARLMSLAVDRTYDCFPGGNLMDLGSSSMA